MSEEEGTFTNLRGRVQRFTQAKAAPGFARPSWFALADLLGELGGPSIATSQPSDVFAAMVAARSEFGGLSYDSLGMKGAVAGSALAEASA
jgi:NADH-quinone oxidoreductase subunit G